MSDVGYSCKFFTVSYEEVWCKILQTWLTPTSFANQFIFLSSQHQYLLSISKTSTSNFLWETVNSQVGHPIVWQSSFDGDQLELVTFGPKEDKRNINYMLVIISSWPPPDMNHLVLWGNFHGCGLLFLNLFCLEIISKPKHGKRFVRVDFS